MINGGFVDVAVTDMSTVIELGSVALSLAACAPAWPSRRVVPDDAAGAWAVGAAAWKLGQLPSSRPF
jgi:hypothetical protein